MRIVKRVALNGLGLELELLPRKVAEAADQALSCESMVAAAKAFCPVRTGALRNSIRAERRGPLSTTLVAGGGEVSYARVVHEGTSSMPPRSFLLQAVKMEKLRFARELLARTGEAV